MSMLSGFKWAFHCCSRVHHLPWAVGSYVIGQEIYSICVTKELMEIQVFQYLTLCYSKCLRNNQWNSITSQNCFHSNTASYPRTASPVTQHRIPELLPQGLCHITKLLPWWHSVTSQNHSPSDTASHHRRLELPETLLRTAQIVWCLYVKFG